MFLFFYSENLPKIPIVPLFIGTICRKNHLLRKTTLLNLSPELLQEKIVAFAQSTQKFFQEFRHILFFQEFRIVYTIGSKQYKCTIQYVEYVFLPHFSCFFSRIQISPSQSTQKFFKNSDYLHCILKEKKQQRKNTNCVFFFYSENLPRHISGVIRDSEGPGRNGSYD